MHFAAGLLVLATMPGNPRPEFPIPAGTRLVRAVAIPRSVMEEGHHRWHRLRARGNDCFVATGNGVACFAVGDADARFLARPAKSVTSCLGDPFSVFDLDVIAPAHVVAADLGTSQVYALDQAQSRVLDGLSGCMNVVKLDHGFCGARPNGPRSPSRLLVVVNSSAKPVNEFYDSASLDGTVTQLNVATDGSHIFVAHLFSKAIEVFAPSGDPMPSIDISWDGYKSIGYRPRDLPKTLPDRYATWHRSWTPCVNLVASCELVVAQFFVGVGSFRTIVVDLATRRRIVDTELPLVEDVDDRTLFLSNRKDTLWMVEVLHSQPLDAP